MGIGKIPNNLQVVDSGSGDGWRWKKYSDGTAEAWGWLQSNVTSFTAWGSVYYSNQLAFDFPTDLFVESPYCQYNLGQSERDSWLATRSGGYTKAKMPILYLITSSNIQNLPFSVSLSVYAYGRWK